MLLSQYMICCFSLCSLGFVSSCFSTFCRFSILLFKHSVVSVYGLLFRYMFSYFSVCYVVSVSSSFSICSVVSELAGPKCTIEGSGFVLPFFPAAAKKPSWSFYGTLSTLSRSTSVIVGLPCRYSPDSVELHFCDCNSWHCQANTRLTTLAILSADTSSKHQTVYSGDPISADTVRPMSHQVALFRWHSGQRQIDNSDSILWADTARPTPHPLALCTQADARLTTLTRSIS